MKNIFLGIIGMCLILYTAVLELGMVQIYSRKNEINNCLAEVLESTLKDHYYIPGNQNNGVCAAIPRENIESLKDNEEIAKQVTEDLRLRLGADSDIEIRILACDMEKGILSAQVTELFLLPTGREKMVSGKKTVIVEREIIEN